MCSATRTSTLAAAVAVALLTVGRSSAAGAPFSVIKCCPAAEALTNRTECAKISDGVPHEFKVPKIVNESGAFDFYSEDQYIIRYGMPKCEDVVRMLPKNDNDESFNITDKGYIQSMIQTFPSDEFDYCFEKFFSDGNFYYISLLCNIKAPCGEEDPRDHCPCIPGHYVENKCPRPSTSSLLIFMVVSLFFLALTFIVYAFNNELQNVNGKSLMCHVASLFFAYSALIYNHHKSSTMVEINTHCILIAYFQQFSFIATFFWLNVMCIEIWWNFRKLKVTTKDYEKKKFIIYSIYAWGCSILILIWTYIMDNFTSLDFRPKFGHGQCWFKTRKAQLLYFYGPISVLLFSNLLMFIHIVIMIFKHDKYANVFNGSEQRRENQENENSKFKLYLSLFIIMGLNWIAEIIVWALDAPGYFWKVIDIGNALQGLFIFINFVCSKPVLRLLNRKLCPQFQLIQPYSTARNSVDNTTM